jgi:hypothetical protein
VCGKLAMATRLLCSALLCSAQLSGILTEVFVPVTAAAIDHVFFYLNSSLPPSLSLQQLSPASFRCGDLIYEWMNGIESSNITFFNPVLLIATLYHIEQYKYRMSVFF